MKNLTLVVPASIKEPLADALREYPEVTGFIFTPVEGHGARTSHDERFSDRDRVAGYVPRARVDLVLDEVALESLLERLRTHAGLAGRCVYWVTELDRFGRL